MRSMEPLWRRWWGRLVLGFIVVAEASWAEEDAPKPTNDERLSRETLFRPEAYGSEDCDSSDSDSDKTGRDAEFHGEALKYLEKPLETALGYIKTNPRLDRVDFELPAVAVEPFKYVQMLDTQTFMRVVNSSDGKITLVAFFDPRSESYLVARKRLEDTGKMIDADPQLSAKVQIGAVNVAVDTYLQYSFSPETTLTWQENEVKANSESLGFLVGKNNFFAIILKLFQRGRTIDEYTGVLTPKRLYHYLEVAAATGIGSLKDSTQISSFLEEKRPSVVACFDKAAKHACNQLYDGFHEVAEDSQWLSYFGMIRDAGLCKSVSPAVVPCSLLVTTEDGDHLSIHQDMVVKLGQELGSPFGFALSQMILDLRENHIVELSPDNSWEIIDRNRYIAIILVDYRNEAVLHEMISRFSGIAKDPKLDAIKFTYADGFNFAGQFGLEIDQLPNLVFYVDELQETVVYDTKRTKGTRRFSLMDHQQNIVEFLRHELESARQALDTAGEEIRQVDTALDDSLDEALWDTENEDSTKQESNVETEKEEEEETEIASFAKVQSHASQSTWRNLELIAETDIHEGSVDELWSTAASLYEEIMLYEEAYNHFSDAQKDLPQNIVQREILDTIHEYLRKRTHWAPMLRALPRTPKDCKLLYSGGPKQQEAWANIQKMSAFLEVLAQEVVETKDQEILAAFKQDIVFLKNQLIRMLHERTEAFQESFLAKENRHPSESDRKKIEIERRSAKDLSMTEFVQDYASKRKPVIITDLDLFKTNWTISHIAEKCGHHSPEFRMKSETTSNWGGLIDVKESITLSTFLQTHRENATRAKWYLHDWSLPRACPEIFGPPPYEEFRFPKYFAGDYFQRMPFVGFQHSWPSLFVGANGTESKMHIDAGGTNFWMYLIEGKKLWRFFDRFEVGQLYREPLSARFFTDVFRPNFEQDPLVATAPLYEGIQEPGDLVFIPGGCPHGVLNLDHIVGISMNLVDASNQDLYLATQMLEGDYKNVERFGNPSFPRGLRSDQEDLTFGEFKSQRWYEMQEELDLFAT